jgi:carbonic anhydrase
MKKLIDGIVEFRKTASEETRELFAKLALGQKPDALFIACSDSRVVPNIFASTDPGDLFVIRHIGNLVPPFNPSCNENAAQAAIEFSIFSLNINDIIVCGHSECGAMKAIAEKTKHENCPHMEEWLKYGAEARERVSRGFVTNNNLTFENQVSQANVLLQMEHIKSYPFIRERIDQKKLRVHGWWFDIGHADVYSYEPIFDRFVLIDENESKLIIQRLGK